jgi:hypothetical protein
MKVMYALTKPPALNLGRQTGIQDEAAGELKIDGEWIVFMIICRSRSQFQLAGKGKTELRGIPAGCIECFLGLIKVTTRLLAIRMTYNISFRNKISARMMNE